MQKQTIPVHVNAKLEWSVGRDEASGRFIAICEAIGLTMEGDSYRDLMENISDSLHLLLSSLMEDNALKR